ncbi:MULTISPECIES: hypothetical protein [Deinococcus]|uniref:Lipoprotein n=1 Tax=Deinococcus enclensis TaxID=1049582 RepID=A0ABT9MHD4_9DEIO|nr:MULTISPECIES: hypothetical protein [Deinococcus]MDP9766010.1 hypothetical protein [Deinococcus enclensis]GHF79531.1 hypothetical protein GCM10017782_16760 [Deinococcus ficus]
MRRLSVAMLIFFSLISSCRNQKGVSSTEGEIIEPTDKNLFLSNEIRGFTKGKWESQIEWLSVNSPLGSSLVPGPTDTTIYAISRSSANLREKSYTESDMNALALGRIKQAYPELDELLLKGKNVDIESMVMPSVFVVNAIKYKDRLLVVMIRP